MDQVSLVKADERKNQWAEIIQACKSSGMTIKHGVLRTVLISDHITIV